MDRFCKLTERMQAINGHRATFGINVKTKGHTGILSRIVGLRAGDLQKELDALIEPEDVYQEQSET